MEGNPVHKALLGRVPTFWQLHDSTFTLGHLGLSDLDIFRFVSGQPKFDC